jgi:hypothetical protein
MGGERADASVGILKYRPRASFERPFAGGGDRRSSHRFAPPHPVSLAMANETPSALAPIITIRQHRHLPLPGEAMAETGRTVDLVAAVHVAFAAAREEIGALPAEALDIEGMSGRKYRHFANNLIRLIHDPAYLEIGSWAGSTLCASIAGNRLRALAVDNWSAFGGPVATFFANLARFSSVDTRVSVLFEDFRSVDYRQFGPFNVFLFDGPHTYQDHRDALAQAFDALTDEFVFIVDDWNWLPVRSGTWQSIQDRNLDVLLAIEVRTSDDETHGFPGGKDSEWHNGCLISVLRKPTS